MIAPWRTDAPVYHRPWATLGLILANILVYFMLGVPGPPRETLWGTVGGEMSAAAHTIGAGLGFAAGTSMVKRGWVDTEDEA
ncbi:MAG: hypothetical protein O7C98_13215 [Planctomycetota bacterium]|nr:hypothetical protein [Planctomycetota bacterium]